MYVNVYKIGVSVSEPHTSGFNAGFSLLMCDVVWYVISKIAINISIFNLDRIYAACVYYSASASTCRPRTPAQPCPYRAANGCGRVEGECECMLPVVMV